MVPDFRRDDVWMPPYQVRGRLLKSGMTENAVYGQTLSNGRIIASIRNGVKPKTELYSVKNYYDFIDLEGLSVYHYCPWQRR